MLPADQTAVSLGMAILSTDAAGTPRLVRSIVPRVGPAGMTPGLAARDHVGALARLWVPQGQPMALVERGSQRLRNGAMVVRLGQEVDGVGIHRGELRVLLHTDGSLAAVSGTLLPAAIKPRFVSTAREALDRALDQLHGAQRARPAITETGDHGGWRELSVAADPALRVISARARPELTRVDDKWLEAWSVEVEGDAPLDPLGDPSMRDTAARRYLVSDAGGKILGDVNLVHDDAFVYRVYAETTGNRRPLDSARESFDPHPTGTVESPFPGVVPSNLVVMEAFNGPHDRWLPDDATTAAGNNVEAFSDIDGTSTFTPGDTRAEVRSGRVLNYNYDLAVGPMDTPEQVKAGIVNAFFVANWQHNWWYDSGFTEITGNAQLDNYGRGGVPGDRLIMATQFSANNGLRDNASMSTPADGRSPRMAIRLRTAATTVSLATPSGAVVSEAFGVGPRAFELTGEVALASDGTVPVDDACQPITSNVTGKIVLITFSGVCGSAATVNAARAAGAAGLILADGTFDDPRAFAGSAPANIPGVAIGRSAGAALQAAVLAGPVTVTIGSTPPGPERDGAVGNDTISHEWGHYLHHRLADCGGLQCGGMSEGWGDFNALMLMLREGDNRDGAYPYGVFASANGAPNRSYFGIRRFPYSRDRSKNDLSLRHIGDENPLPTETPGNLSGSVNSEVHNAGEVWATMMWEALNVLIDEHGVTVARRRMSDYVVAGLLLTPPDATFTEGRDGILAAASALDTDDMILMAAAFAGRGAGSCAVSPPTSSPTNAGVVESGTLAPKLQLGGVSLVDDGVSCDQDGYLDPGESGQLRVTVVNAGILAAEALTITATTTQQGVRLGAPIRIAALQPFSSAELTIPVTLLPTAPRNASLAISLRATASETCDRAGVTASLSTLIGADDVADAARIDRVETRTTPWARTGDGASGLWGIAADATGNPTWFARNAASSSDTRLESPALQLSATEPFVVRFSHAYDLERSGATLFDGGMIELSTDGGTTWRDVSELGASPGYDGALAANTQNPLGGRLAYSGRSAGFPARIPVVLSFGTQLAGQSVRLRFRIGTDAGVAATGWAIDDIEASGITNTPFPIRVTEPSTCTARKALDDSSVIATIEAPATSLAAFDNAACIAGDTP